MPKELTEGVETSKFSHLISDVYSKKNREVFFKAQSLSILSNIPAAQYSSHNVTE